jgi:hypothetical protein
MATGVLPPLKPLPIKERISVVFVERGELDVLDGAFVVVDATGVRTHIPVGGVACSVFPTCVGINVGGRYAHRLLRRVPHVRGDKPDDREANRASTFFSESRA